MTMTTGICIALTGGIACGKSTVCGFWREWGVETIDADNVAHALIAPGGPYVDAVAAAFGENLRRADGGIDRRCLAEIVFHDAAALQKLNDLLHPPVLRHIREWSAVIRREGRHGAAAIPLLYEARAESGWDTVVCVAACPATVFERLKARGLSHDEAEARLATQWPVRQKCARADIVIENNGTREELKDICRRVWQEIFKQETPASP